MGDNKVLLKAIKEHIKANRIDEEIIRDLKFKGYTEKEAIRLIKKAKRPKKILLTLIILILVISIATVAFYTLSSKSIIKSKATQALEKIKNPLEGVNVILEKSNNSNQSTNSSFQEIYIDDINITSDFIEYLIYQIGAIKYLHKNLITREAPIINFKIEDISYSAKISDSISVEEGLNTKADIQFNSDKKAMIMATMSDEPAEVFKGSINEGTTTIEKIAGDTELFAKGYLDLYKALK